MNFWDNDYFYIIGRDVLDVFYSFYDGKGLTLNISEAVRYTSIHEADRLVDELNHNDTTITYTVMGGESGTDEAEMRVYSLLNPNCDYMTDNHRFVVAKHINKKKGCEMRKSENMSKMLKSVRRNRVVKSNGIRKYYPIRKYQDSYYLSVAYVGLLELKYKQSSSFTDRRVYRGELTVDTKIGDVTVKAYMEITTKTYDEFDIDTSSTYRYVVDETSSENVSLWRDNMAGMTEVNVEGALRYSATKADGFIIELYKKDVSGYAVEDVLDMLTQVSEEAWGDVQIAIGDVASANSAMEEIFETIPRSIKIPTPTFELELEFKGNYEHTYLQPTSDRFCWKGDYEADVGEGIRMSAFIMIVPEQTIEGEHTDEDRYFGRHNITAPVDYYSVYVRGEIKDTNTQVSMYRNNEHADSWDRIFSGQGSESLEGAIAIASQNIAEVYQEAVEYKNSVREYVQHHYGRGYLNTTVNTNEWNYNYGDSFNDDVDNVPVDVYKRVRKSAPKSFNSMVKSQIMKNKKG